MAFFEEVIVPVSAEINTSSEQGRTASGGWAKPA